MIELGRMTPEEYKGAQKFPLCVILDNVRSLNNIGSLFRSSDAFGVERMALCGITATPPSPEIHKTALGAEETVEWKHYPTTLEAIGELKTEGWTICCVEQCEGSVSLEEFRVEPGRKYAIMLGHEVYGVDQQAVDASDVCLEIPQFGTKHSLNVAVTGGILLWHLASQMLP